MKEWIMKHKKQILLSAGTAAAGLSVCAAWSGIMLSGNAKEQETSVLITQAEKIAAGQEIHTLRQEQIRTMESAELENQEKKITQESNVTEDSAKPTLEKDVSQKTAETTPKKIASKESAEPAQESLQASNNEIDRSGGVAKPVEVNRGSSSPKALEDNSYLGVFRTTAYCACESCSEGWGNQTATGVPARPNRTIAVDPKVIKLGSKVVIDGKEYIAEDTGGAIKGNKIDIFFADHAEAMRFGVRSKEVYLAK